MEHHASLLPALLLLAACTSTRPAAHAPDDAAARLAWMDAGAVLWQHASAEAFWLFEQGYEHAHLKLMGNIAALSRARTADAPQRPMAVIVDIDETVLDNSPHQIAAIRRGRTFNTEDWHAWTSRAEAKACPGAVAFLRFAAQHAGCEVFYITNRDTSERAATLRNLRELGFPHADEAHLLPMEGTSDKTDRRARVRATHDVVLLVGDQLRDFDERFKDRTTNHGKDLVAAMADSLHRYFVLLPNPMYGTWRDAVQGKGTDAERLARMRLWFEQNGY